MWNCFSLGGLLMPAVTCVPVLVPSKETNFSPGAVLHPPDYVTWYCISSHQIFRPSEREGRMTCKSLYIQCLEFCIPRLENYARVRNCCGSCKWMEDLAAPVVEDMLNHAFYLANDQGKSMSKIWREEWKIFFTGKMSSAILKWDFDLINHMRSVCTSLKKCRVVVVGKFDPDLVLKLPKTVTILDFDGDLIDRGKVTKPLLFLKDTSESWLPHAEKILKALQILRILPQDYPSTPNTNSLSEINLSTVQATSSDLKIIIENSPNLRLLHHYQMVTALYELHSTAWRKKQALPKYKFKNLDVDFSHVVRCRMSPEWTLSPDALLLAVALCPSATSIRVRFDCSTPHDVLSPLLGLSKVKELSAVCVSSGERTLLDFSDMAPILEKFGPTSLTLLELKVIEEVEIHVIIEHCTRVETLILSGCGYVTPPTCSSFNCQTYTKGSFRKLKALFYADGDDFSWDHGVPECFWKASLCPSGKSRPVQLEGLFLEFPRMSASLIKEIIHTKTPKLPFPELQALSLCRFHELTTNDVAAICGISPTGTSPCQGLKYIRLSDCDRITDAEEKRLRKWLKHSNLSHVRLDVDSPPPIIKSKEIGNMDTNTSVISRVLNGYDNLFAHADPRVEDLLLMQSPLPIVAICLGYIYFVLSLGPKLMADRKPFNLRGILIFYNAAQTVFSAVLFYEACRHWYTHYGLLECVRVNFDSLTPSSLKEIRMCHIYFLSKISELLDTVFFVLKKKDSHVSLLHVFHHAAMPFSVWVGVKFHPGGNLAFFGIPNLFVHIWMYFYYMMAAMGPQYHKYIWWKRHITEMQLAQFAIVMFYILTTSIKCTQNWRLVTWILALDVAFVVLFLDFYRKAYKQKREKKTKELENNGGAITTAAVETANGSLSANKKNL